MNRTARVEHEQDEHEEGRMIGAEHEEDEHEQHAPNMNRTDMKRTGWMQTHTTNHRAPGAGQRAPGTGCKQRQRTPAAGMQARHRATSQAVRPGTGHRATGPPPAGDRNAPGAGTYGGYGVVSVLVSSVSVSSRSRLVLASC